MNDHKEPQFIRALEYQAQVLQFICRRGDGALFVCICLRRLKNVSHQASRSDLTYVNYAQSSGSNHGKWVIG